MNPLVLLALTGTLNTVIGGLTGGTGATSMTSMLPLMLMSGGGKMNQMSMLGLVTNNPMLILMGATQKSTSRRRSYRRSSGNAYWKGYARGLRGG